MVVNHWYSKCFYYLRISWTLWINIYSSKVIWTTFVRNNTRKIDNFLSGSIEISISTILQNYFWKISKYLIITSV